MKDKKITILFDANPLTDNQKSGVGYYTKGLIEALASTYPENIKLVGHYFNFLGKKDVSDLPNADNIQYKVSTFIHPKILSLLRKVHLQIPYDFLIKTKGDFALFTNFVCLPTIFPVKKGIVVHDVCFKERPEFVQQKNRRFLQYFVPVALRKSDVVFTISEATKNAIVSNYNVQPSKIHITPIPLVESTTDNKVSDVLSIKGSYFLFVGTLEPRKNFMSLVNAYVALPSNIKSQYSLVLAGKPGWNVETEMKTIKELQQKGEDIILTGYISDAEKEYLYKNASLFVAPSFYEGFGMPIVEAFHARVPVLANDIPVFREVGGNAAAYVDTADVEKLKEAMIRIITSQPERGRMVSLGTSFLKNYKWEDVAKTVYSEIKHLL